MTSLLTTLQEIARTRPLALLFVPLGLLAFAFAWREFGGAVRRRLPRVGPRPAEPETLPPLTVTPGTSLSRIPAYRARILWHCGRTGEDASGLVDDLLAMGLSLNASDIHLTPAQDEATVALRVHGTLYDLGRIPAPLYVKLVSRVKVMASLAIYKRAVPQDGELDVLGGRHKARVSVLPTNHGEKVVLRLASVDYGTYRLAALGLDPDQEILLEGLLNTNQGMIVVTGPTGSGKTTTMYAALLHIVRTRGDSTNIVTLEDPIEFDFPSFTQTQIDPASGLTFAVALRSVLRQDPDVILVGEIRDDETAAIAVRAAMTGHLIFTTLHADRAAGVFNRIIQQNVERYQVASAVKAVISQRLCQQLCPACRGEAPLTDSQQRQFRFLGFDPPPDGPFFASKGCPDCLGKGVKGRVAAFEMLVVTDVVRDLINEGMPTHHIEKAAVEGGMRTLFDHGLALARDGTISVDEMLRVLAT